MKSYTLTHLADHVLLNDLTALVTQDRTTTAALLAHLAEVDERRLYLPAAHASMYSYCIRELRMSEDTAFKRIQAARAAREFPAVFPMVADGRLHLTAVVRLAPYLNRDNVDDLLTAATHKTKPEIEVLLAERFPRPDVPTFVRALVPVSATEQLALRPAEAPAFQLVPEQPVPCNRSNMDPHMEQLVPEPVVPSDGPNSPKQMGPLSSSGKLTPLSPGRFALQVTVDLETHEQMRYARELLGHALPSGEIAHVIKLAMRELVDRLEKRKFAACVRARPRQGAPNGRYVSAEIRRTVWQRDGGQCTFVSAAGRRCEERTRMEFDHIDAVARGGETTLANMRLRCRAHNQLAAECTFGTEFMRGKREEARCRAAEAKAKSRAKTLAEAQARAKSEAKAQAEARAKAEAKAQAEAQAAAAAEVAREKDVTPWLRQLGFNVAEARRGAANCAHIPDASLEERVRIAARSLAPNFVRRPAPVASSTS